MLTLLVNGVDNVGDGACTGGLLADERTANACHPIDRLVPPRGLAGQRGGGSPADRLSVFGYQPPGAAGTSFLFGIAVGAVTSLRRLLRTDLWPAASRAADHRWAVARHHRETEFINQDHDNRLDHQARADKTTGHHSR